MRQILISERSFMKNGCSWLPEAVAIAGVAIGVGVAFQGWPSWPKVNGATWASWAQAVGTVVAIIAAYFEGRRQAAAALRAARESATVALKSKRASVLAVVDAACGRTDEICSVIQPTEEGRAGLWLVYHASIVESMSAALSAAPVLNWSRHLRSRLYCAFVINSSSSETLLGDFMPGRMLTTNSSKFGANLT